MRKLATVLLLCSLAGRAAGQCCGDCNGDGQVTINDLITAVNNALGSCGEPTATPTVGRTATPSKRPTATPTPNNRCPSTFADNGTSLCIFNGTFNRGCGNALSSVFGSDGSTVVVTIDTMLSSPPTVSFAAQVVSPTSANLTGWSSNDFATTHPTSGTLQLTNNGNQLVIFPNDPPFMILGCNFVQYTGTYVGVPGATAALAPAMHAEPQALERLRAWRARPVPDLAAP